MKTQTTQSWFQKGTAICVLRLALAGAGVAQAAPHVAPDSVTGAPGETISIPLRLTGTVSSSAGFNATLYLPAGMVFAGMARGALLPAPAFRLTAQPLAAPAVNAVAILGYSESQTFTGPGVLCTLSVSIPATAGPGDYLIVLDSPDRSVLVRGSHALSSSSGDSSTAHTVSDGVLSVRIPGVPGDINGNGIRDQWEMDWFGAITNVNDQTDFDGDGLSDYREYLSKTNPKNPASCLAITLFGVQDPVTGGVTLQWYSIVGRTYRIERATDLVNPFAFSRVGQNVLATSPINTYRDYPPTGTTSLFYRIILLAD